MTNSALLKKIDKIVAKRNSPANLFGTQLQRQQRLKFLVDTYGLIVVARAAGLSEASLNQYLRNKRPASIGEQSVVNAEEVIAQL